jgi:leader peptidase (prepilin peptidase)/N-methyltransferase
MLLTAPALVGVVVFAGVLGLVIGSFLNVVIHRVPAGVSLTRESRCPECDSPVKPWQNVPVLAWLALRGKCASCGRPIAARYPVIELVTGLAFAAIVWFFLATSSLPPAATAVVIAVYLYFAAISIALAVIDVDTHRLPDAIVLPSYVVIAVLLTLACVLGADWGALLRAVIGALALYAFYFVLRVVRPAGMGGGDVKLAGIVGAALAWLGWGSLVVGAFAAFLLGGIFGVLLIALRRAGRKTAIPFGPWMLAGAWVGVVSGQAIAVWYVERLLVP